MPMLIWITWKTYLRCLLYSCKDVSGIFGVRCSGDPVYVFSILRLGIGIAYAKFLDVSELWYVYACFTYQKSVVVSIPSVDILF